MRQSTKTAEKETLARRTSTGRRRHRLRARSCWTWRKGTLRSWYSERISRQFRWILIILILFWKLRRGIRQTYVTCRERSAGFCTGSASMRVVPRNMRIMSRPGICSDIPGRVFCYPILKNLCLTRFRRSRFRIPKRIQVRRKETWNF